MTYQSFRISLLISSNDCFTRFVSTRFHSVKATDSKQVENKLPDKPVVSTKAQVSGNKSRQKKTRNRSVRMKVQDKGPKLSKFKFISSKQRQRYELVRNIPSKSEVFLGRVTSSYVPQFERLHKSLVSYTLANFQFNHEKRRDISTELEMKGNPTRVQVAKKLGKSMFELALACAEYYTQNVLNELEHREVGLDGKIKLPILFLRFCGILDRKNRTEKLDSSDSYLFIRSKGVSLPDLIRTSKKPKYWDELVKDGIVDSDGPFYRYRTKIFDPDDFVENLIKLRNIFEILDPSMNVDFNIYEDKPVTTSFLSCLVSESDDSYAVIHSETLPSELDVTESILFGVKYEIRKLPAHCQGNILYNIPKDMSHYLGLRYWECVFGEKGITAVSRLETSSFSFDPGKAYKQLNVAETVAESVTTEEE